MGTHIQQVSGRPEHEAGIVVTHGFVPASDGYPLAVTTYAPQREAGTKTLVLASSVGGDRRRYAAFARFLGRRGWTVLTFDYRGIGGSLRGRASRLPATMQDWGEKDAAGLIDWVGAHWRPRLLLALGHSVGGQIFGLAPNHGRLDGLLLVASQVGFWRLRPGLWKYVTLGFFTAVPGLVKLFGDLPLWPTGSDRLPPGVAHDWRRWCLAAEYTDGAGRSLRPRFEAFTAPILALSFADDPLYAPAAAAGALVRLYANAPSEHRHYHPRELGLTRMGHRGFFVEGRCPRLWEETWAWLERPGCARGERAFERAPARHHPLAAVHSPPFPASASPNRA